MSDLLERIRRTNSSAANTLERADICTDSDIKSLTLEDLRELLPGPNKIKLRRTIFQIIQKHNSVEEFIRKLKVIVQDEVFSAALTNNEVLDDDVCMLKKMKIEMNGVIDDRITQLEERRAEGSTSIGPKLKTDTVKYRMVVAGQTFSGHLQLMEKVVAASGKEVVFTQSSEDHQITLLFCPISSRVESDVEGAMCLIKDEKPVLLVLMNHTHQAATSATPRLLNHDPRIVFYVTVNFHETKNGLLKCEQNDTAAIFLQNKLMEYKTPGNAVNDQDSSSGRFFGLWPRY
ncbi:uncharacterized protein V6R79_010078 [Siganus canaliculatus]